jgi:hypothetical protein
MWLKVEMFAERLEIDIFISSHDNLGKNKVNLFKSTLDHIEYKIPPGAGGSPLSATKMHTYFTNSVLCPVILPFCMTSLS